MDEQSGERHPLEDFPRVDLYQGIGRRQVWATLLVELHLKTRHTSGAVGIKIPALGSLPDDRLAGLVPALLPEWKVALRDGTVWAEHRQHTEGRRLFNVDPLSLYAFNQINGRNSLQQVAGRLANAKALPGARAFAITRGLFLTLVKAGVCLPVNNPFIG